MSDERPPKPDPACVWDEPNRVWLWPDDRTPEQREADELAAELAETGEWEQHGFKRTHGARVTPDSPT